MEPQKPWATNGPASLPVWEELVIVAAGTPWDGIWMSERHVAMHLSERVPVLWVDPPISRMTPLRDRVAAHALREDRLRLVTPRILRLTPVAVPGVTRPLLRDVGSLQQRLAIRRAVARIGATVRATIAVRLDDVMGAVPSARQVFYGTDDYVAGAELMGVGAGWLARAERRALRRADIVVAVSPTLVRKWSRERPDVVMVPNGCNTEHFASVDDAPPPADVRLPAPIAGFVGHMSERIDLAKLEAVADTGASLLLVGPRQPTFEMSRMNALLMRRNVQWVGQKPFSDLPSYLRIMRVGLTPYAVSDFNRASFPLKTLEYLAGGLPVVATDLPAHRWLASPHVAIAVTDRAFAEATRRALDAPADAASAHGRRCFAAGHSWRARAAEIEALLDLGGSTSAPVRPSVPPPSSAP